MLPTPSTSHVNLNQVYEPAEDSFLLLDTLSSIPESAFLARRFGHRPETESVNPARPAPPLIVEIGPGSGVVLAFITAHAQHIIGRIDVLTLGVDINAYACAATNRTVLQACRETSSIAGGRRSTHAVFVGCMNADLSSCLRHGVIDLLVFNPPYVPTAELPSLPIIGHSNLDVEPDRFKEDAHLLSLSYAGGRDGMEVTDRLLSELPGILDKERGVAYILLCKQNKPESVVQRIQGWGTGWTVEVVGESDRTGGWEKLQILRICRTVIEGNDHILAREQLVGQSDLMSMPPHGDRHSPTSLGDSNNGSEK